MNKQLVVTLSLLAVFTLFFFNLDTSEGVVVDNPEDKVIRWEGADYTLTTVEVELSDSVLSKTGEADYWFDTSVIDYSLGEDGYTVTLDFDVRPNTLTDMLNSPSLSSAKLDTFNADYSYMGETFTLDNLNTVLGDLNNIPLITRSGEVVLSKAEPITVDKAYQAIITLENAYAGTRQSRFKLGRNSFTYTVSTHQNWIDNTLTIENISIDDGRLILDNDNAAPGEGGNVENYNDASELIIGDTMLRQEAPDTNYGNTAYIQIGPDGAGAKDYYAMYLYDISNIPAGSTIDNAQLYIRYHANVGAPVTDVYLTDNRLWDENIITWNLFDNALSASLDTVTLDLAAEGYEMYEVGTGVQTAFDAGDHASFVIQAQNVEAAVRWLAKANTNVTLDPDASYLEVWYSEPAEGVYENVGEWFSVHWEVGVATVIENLVIHATSDLRGEWDLSANTSTVAGIAYLPPAIGVEWYLLDSDGDNIDQYDTDWAYKASMDLPSTSSSALGVDYGNQGAVHMLLICDSGNSEVDNYDISGNYQSKIDVSGEMVHVYDVEYMENDDTYWVLSDTTADNAWLYNSLGAYTGMTIDLGLDPAGFWGFAHDEEDWYVVEARTDVIYQFDNTFTLVDAIRSVGADDGTPMDLYSDLTNIYMVGSATDTVYMYSLDNTLDNIYAMICADTDNDNIMDENTGWHLMDESGYWDAPDNGLLSLGYNYQVGFMIETDNTPFSPRIASFELNVNYEMEWISVENWSDNFTVTGYDWTSAENWHNEFRVEGEGTSEPLTDISDLIEDFFVPLFVLFVPAFAFGKKMGEVGFMGGLLAGVMTTYIAFDFGLGIAIFLMLLVAIMYMKSK